MSQRGSLEGSPRGGRELLRALPLATKRRLTLVAATLGGFTAVYYLVWWLQLERLSNPLLLAVFPLAAAYVTAQVLSAWFIYAHVEEPPARLAPEGLTVDVFVPVYDEDEALVANCLAAVVAIKYPHRTFLLDDAGKESLRVLAARLGVIYVRRQDRRDAKAGNVNHALRYSDAEFVTVFDVDHVPAPYFLHSVLGHFEDPRVAFVQAYVAQQNWRQSFVARAVSDQAFDIYSPTSMGMYGCGAAPIWGAHCTFRRAALDSIGGHQAGLAEDLHTSLALHAAHWRSVYVPEVLARGLVPADLRAYFIQQLKWSRGVFGMLIEALIPKLPHLHPRQVVCYLARMTYYLVGPAVLATMISVAALLFSDDPTQEEHFASYLAHFAPMAAMFLLVRTLMSAMWEQDCEAPSSHLAGLALTFGSWPIYTFSLICACLRVRLPHLPTPKVARGGAYLWLVLPQLAMVGVLLAGIVDRSAHEATLEGALVIGVALALIIGHGAVFYAVWEGWRLQRTAPTYQPSLLAIADVPTAAGTPQSSPGAGASSGYRLVRPTNDG